jgi:hypothetical protein
MNPVMPAQAGIHDLSHLLQLVGEKTWMPACAGMTMGLTRVKTNATGNSL